MIRRILKGAATVAALPAWIVGNALMVPLLRRQLKREADGRRQAEGERAALGQMLDGVADERDAARRDLQARDIEYTAAEGARREAEDLALRLAAERDEVQRKLSLANRTVCEQIEALHARDAEIESIENEWAGACIDQDRVCQQRDRARRWASLWHAKAGEYRFLWRNACGQAHDDMRRRREAEGQLEALKVRMDGKPRCVYCGRDTTARPPVEGDHPADERTQQFASVIEHLTKQRDEDARRLQAAWEEVRALKADLADWRAVRAILADWHAEGETWERSMRIVAEQASGHCAAKDRQIKTLKRELADADRDHDAAMAERQARHREVLAERDEAIAAGRRRESAKDKLIAAYREGLRLYRAAFWVGPLTTNMGDHIRVEADVAAYRAVAEYEKGEVPSPPTESGHG